MTEEHETGVVMTHVVNGTALAVLTFSKGIDTVPFVSLSAMWTTAQVHAE
jgi:hypothetical protein